MSTIERKGTEIFFQFDKQMITLRNGKFVTATGETVDGRKVRNMLRSNNYEQTRAEVCHLKSIFNRFFGGDVHGKQYSF